MLTVHSFTGYKMKYKKLNLIICINERSYIFEAGVLQYIFESIPKRPGSIDLLVITLLSIFFYFSSFLNPTWPPCKTHRRPSGMPAQVVIATEMAKFQYLNPLGFYTALFM